MEVATKLRYAADKITLMGAKFNLDRMKHYIDLIMLDLEEITFDKCDDEFSIDDLDDNVKLTIMSIRLGHLNPLTVKEELDALDEADMQVSQLFLNCYIKYIARSDGDPLQSLSQAMDYYYDDGMSISLLAYLIQLIGKDRVRNVVKTIREIVSLLNYGENKKVNGRKIRGLARFAGSTISSTCKKLAALNRIKALIPKINERLNTMQVIVDRCDELCVMPPLDMTVVDPTTTSSNLPPKEDSLDEEDCGSGSTLNSNDECEKDTVDVVVVAV